MPESDTSRSLEEIEDDRWGDPPADATRLISTAYALRRRPVGEIGVEGLRLLISQQIGLDTLVPLALDHVEQDPLAEGDFYPGDLLDALMRRVPESYWQAHEGQRARVRAVAEALDPGETFDVLYTRAAEFLRR
ncbi:contact-dependent growth inhibition system immunity protein [Couchioplanes caeruleus]|uniref:contact-dependent growth inhibition system immunity protein n=1 Tax=Couchioplanes caeruleus TaxID=56438 RepID=UPI0020BFEF92|nr:contact-dependent growth inhibition system immunity protein [Couchioplanes caeruleus]UQU64315.1 contact-dependent growth inhibition system immunity protein [Couchioplanes caeruleus]